MESTNKEKQPYEDEEEQEALAHEDGIGQATSSRKPLGKSPGPLKGPFVGLLLSVFGIIFYICLFKTRTL